MLDTILQLIISGTAMGFVYALVGVEYTLVWQSAGLLNIAHSMLITMAAFVFGGTFVMWLGLPIWLSIILTLIFMYGMGYLISKLIFNPLRNSPGIMYSIVGTMIFAKIISEALRLSYGPYTFTIRGFLTGVIKIGDFVFPKTYGYIIVVSVLLIIALQMFLKHTKVGKAMRCVAQNRTAAAIMGINVSASINITTAISTVICGIIGIMIIPRYQISTSMAAMIGLKGWAAGIVGGFGYIPGTILGGVLIGIIEALVILAIPSTYKDVVAFMLLITILLLRPGGLMRHRV
jgi:branched-chain amino acid transport system permease protein